MKRNDPVSIVRSLGRDELESLVLERILGTFSSTGIHFQAEILAEERLLERLCELARSHPDVMQVHYKLIGRLFPNDAAKYLENRIRKELERAHSRNGYRAIAAELREYRGFAGTETAVAFVEELCSIHANRPAMIEELKKASGARGRGPSPERR